MAGATIMSRDVTSVDTATLQAESGKGRSSPPEESYSRTSSDGVPLQGQGQKKKISLVAMRFSR